MGMDEARRIASLLEELRAQPRRDFVDLKEFPVEHGVYVIYGPSVSVLYVGLSKGDKNGLRGRLKGHLHGSRGSHRHQPRARSSRKATASDISW